MPEHIGGPWDFVFSNFAPSLIVDGYSVEYPTVEHAYQAAKSVDIRERYAIARQPSAGAAKRAGRRLALRLDWDRIKLAVMYGFLEQKFQTYNEYGCRLRASGDLALCETNHWHDQYWGDCICPAHADTPGENWLGRLLVTLRSHLEYDVVLATTAAPSIGEQYRIKAEQRALYQPPLIPADPRLPEPTASRRMMDEETGPTAWLRDNY